MSDKITTRARELADAALVRLHGGGLAFRAPGYNDVELRADNRFRDHLLTSLATVIEAAMRETAGARDTEPPPDPKATMAPGQLLALAQNVLAIAKEVEQGERGDTHVLADDLGYVFQTLRTLAQQVVSERSEAFDKGVAKGAADERKRIEHLLRTMVEAATADIHVALHTVEQLRARRVVAEATLDMVVGDAKAEGGPRA